MATASDVTKTIGLSVNGKETSTYRAIAVRLAIAADTAAGTATLQTDTTYADYSLTTHYFKSTPTNDDELNDQLGNVLEVRCKMDPGKIKKDDFFDSRSVFNLRMHSI